MERTIEYDQMVEANFRLIAASPCLLEACKDAMMEIDNLIASNPMGKTYWPDIRAKLSKAINKAEGK